MKFNLIFGSETGTARGLIGQLSNQILALNNESTEQIEIERFSMEEFVKNLDNKEANNLIIICSSTGDGDPPEDSLRFASKLNDLLGSGQKSLAHINFALLGLGDSEYENFGFYPKFVYHGLVQLGAQPKFRFDIADDDSNADAVIEAWLDDILPLVKSWNSGTIPATIHTQPGNSTNGEASANAEAVEATTITINLQDTVISDPNEPLNHPLPRNYDQPIKLDLTELQKLTAISGFPKNPAELINFSLETKQESQNQLSDLEVQLKSHPTAFIGHLTSVESLTASTAVKRTLLVNVQLPEDTEPFLPGDAYGICCPNDTELVDRLLTRLQVPIDNWDQIIKIEPKPNIVLPSHLMNLPQNLTLKQIFVNYLDLNAFPKKAWFRMLADSTSDNNQKQILLAMVSKQGGNLYNQLKGLNPSILDILTYFNTAQPTIERLLDTLPQLQPRYYSAANSPLSTPNQLRLAFNVIQYSLDSEAQYLRHGLCTPWLDQITGHVASNSSNNLNEPHPICLFRKQSQTFHLPTQTTKPVLMIGPGTGVAPFIGFLQHRHYQRKLKKKMGGFSSSITEELKKSFGKMWLIFGTRDPKKDYLFEKELESYLEDGTLSQLNSCFSRLNPNEEIKYVQHVLLQNKEKVFDFITKEGGYIYICGDAKNMAKDVHQALIEILQGPEELNRTKLEATQLLMEFTQEGRYLRDLWA